MMGASTGEIFNILLRVALGIAIVYGPSMKEYFVVITPYTESTALFTIFCKEAVGSGMADEILQTETGGSFDALWDKIVNGA